MNVYTFAQYRNSCVREMAQRCSVSIAEVRREYPDSWWLQEWNEYIVEQAKQPERIASRIVLDDIIRRLSFDVYDYLYRHHPQFVPADYMPPHVRRLNKRKTLGVTAETEIAHE